MNSGGSSTGTPDGPDGTRGSRLVGVFKLLYPGVGVKRTKKRKKNKKK
jgi:hypothetical protein